MSRRITLLIVVLLGVAGGIYFFFRYQMKDSGSQTADENTFNNVPANAKASEQIAEMASKVTGPIKELQRRSEHRSIQFGNIDVTGVVLDQFDQPLTNVVVEFEVDQSGPNSPTSKRGSTTTDGLGAFRISGYEGASIAITPKADGYVLVATNNRVIYSGFFKTNPMHYSHSGTQRVIRMWRLKGGEPLTKVSRTIQFVATHRPVFLDLLTGTLVENGGDLALRIRRPSEALSPENRKDWSLTIEAVDGDLQQVDSMQAQFIFEAPTNGYVPRVTISRKAEDPDWALRTTFTLLVQSRKGTVNSKAAFSFRLNEEPTGACRLKVNVVSNPNGSRNWEEDPNKITRLTD